MEANILISTKGMSHEDWLKYRKKGIGGSDAASIAGMNKWKSPVGVYLDKIGEGSDEEVYSVDENGAFVSGSEAAYWGNKNEDAVAKEFELRTGLKVRRRNAILQHPEHTFMLANVDRLIVGENEGLECKTANEYLKKEWEDEDVPASYLIQCQHYMAVTGYEAWWIAVLIGGNKFKYKRIERDEEIISFLIEIETNFWNNHVIPKTPPMFDGSDASTKLLNSLYPEANYEEEVELPLDADELIVLWEETKKEEAEIKERKQEAENKLKALLGENERGVAGDKKVSWKNVTSTRVDSKLLKTKYPKIYEEVSKQSTSRRFGIK